MRIGEVADQTGLSISNIRFYEKKGLIEPDRQAESRYRDYTAADVYRLKQILLYRKLNLSIEQINEVINEGVSLHTVLQKKSEELLRQKEELQGAIDLCGELLTRDDEEQLDVDYYLNYINEEEKRGISFTKVDDLLEDFAAFTQMPFFRGEQYWLRIFVKPWMVRVIFCVWLALWIVIPVVGMFFDGPMSIRRMLFWLGWLMFVGVLFLAYRKNISKRSHNML